MNLVKDLWAHLKEWSDWKMKDWIKAGIVAIIVLVVISQIGGGGAQTSGLAPTRKTFTWRRCRRRQGFR